jgi:zinc/manganese transport system permease protein
MAVPSFDLLLVPFLAGLLVLATHVPLGRMVLERGIVFIDLAIAQVAGLGVVFADFLGWEASGWSVQASAAGAALLSAFFLIWTERRLPAIQEAVIGVVFVFAASAEILLLSSNPHGAEHMKDLLVGQILWVTPEELLPVLLLYLPVLALAILGDLRRRRWLFYALFAVTITASVQLVGVFLVFTSLIVPALVAQVLGGRWPLLLAYAVGIVGYALGLLASALVDLPTGAAMVCATVLVGAGAIGVTLVKRGRRAATVTATPGIATADRS